MQDEKTKMKAAYIEELLKTRLEIQEETLRNISQEIHDNIGQSLTLVKLTISTVNPEKALEVSAALENSKQLLITTMKDLRNLSHSLNPDLLGTIGLTAMIEQQLLQLEKTGQYKTKFNISGYKVPFEPQKEIVLLRIVQELLNNILKHAAATFVSIDMDYQDQQLIIKIADNGKGFDPDKKMSPKDGEPGIGLLNIQKRINMVNGTINIASMIGKGTTTTLII